LEIQTLNKDLGVNVGVVSIERGPHRMQVKQLYLEGVIPGCQNEWIYGTRIPVMRTDVSVIPTSRFILFMDLLLVAKH